MIVRDFHSAEVAARSRGGLGEAVSEEGSARKYRNRCWSNTPTLHRLGAEAN